MCASFSGPTAPFDKRVGIWVRRSGLRDRTWLFRPKAPLLLRGSVWIEIGTQDRHESDVRILLTPNCPL
jgi:hypothetical protein